MKQYNDIFEASLNLLKTIFEKAPNIGVNILNKDYTVLWANKIMALGCSRELDEMIGKKCYHAFRRRNKPCEVCVLQIVSTTKKAVVLERRAEQPNIVPNYLEVRAFPIFDKDGTVKHIFEILIPLDKKKRAEEQQRKYVESLEKSIRELNAKSPTCIEKKISEAGNLTAREQEIVRLIAQGFSNKEIANILKISLDTVKTHVKNIFLKLDVTDRTKAAIWAASHNLI
jgi:DNA-binding NarL/FixJ family response regulator